MGPTNQQSPQGLWLRLSPRLGSLWPPRSSPHRRGNDEMNSCYERGTVDGSKAEKKESQRE